MEVLVRTSQNKENVTMFWHEQQGYMFKKRQYGKVLTMKDGTPRQSYT